MKYRRLGRSGLRVSEIAYGSWLTFANQVELEKGKKIIHQAIELGINYFDSADVYENGKAEELLGEILPERKRSQYIVATKAFWPFSEYETDRGLSRKHLTDSLQGSLDRLKLKYVDLFYCHRYDPETPLRETLEAIEDLIRQGKILYWGTSEWAASQIAEAYKICEERHWHLPVVNQPLYNLLSRNIEKEILPKCVELGMGTANFSPLAQGILTGKYSGKKIPLGTRGANDKQNMWMKSQIEDLDLLNKVDSLGEIASKYNITMGQLSLAWILQNPGISSVITGATSVKQLEENAGASGVLLDRTDIEQMNRLFPL
ncbi:MAG: aldo/keto reductase family protein [Spirochaetaceae bacterium]|nr:aldo/keto reductase family protein [Spirochaetaceae bacterium]